MNKFLKGKEEGIILADILIGLMIFSVLLGVIFLLPKLSYNLNSDIGNFQKRVALVTRVAYFIKADINKNPHIKISTNEVSDNELDLGDIKYSIEKKKSSSTSFREYQVFRSLKDDRLEIGSIRFFPQVESSKSIEEVVVKEDIKDSITPPKFSISGDIITFSAGDYSSSIRKIKSSISIYNEEGGD